MLRGLGACLVVGGCAGLGGYAVLRHTVRICMLCDFEQLLHFLYGEIAYAGCDMIAILEELPQKSRYFGNFCTELAGCLRGYDGKSFQKHWREKMCCVSGITNLTPEERELLLAVGDHLGTTDRETQLHTLELFLERIHESVGQARREHREKAKVSMVIGVTAGLFLALLLL